MERVGAEVRAKANNSRRKFSDDDLKARGSWLPAARKKAALKDRETLRAASRPEGKGKFTAADAKREIVKIPGYDPYAGAKSYRFDGKRAAEAVCWIQRNLTHVEGELGRAPDPLVLNWEKAVLCNLFGWYHKKTDLRRYREALVFVPRKNSKTTFVAAIVNYMGFCDPEPGGRIYGRAGEREPARHVPANCKTQVGNNAGLANRVRRDTSSIK